MLDFKKLLKDNNIDICSIPDGGVSLVLSQVIKNSENNILYIALNDEELHNIANTIKFFENNIDLVILPSWDCLPYDRVSPKSSIINERINSLNQLINSSNKKIVLVTVNSILQKTIPKEILKMQIFKILKGDKINRDVLITKLFNLGFNRSVTATEPGDFAIRGSIVDIFSNQNSEGWRIDFFGDNVESIKLYDPITQISRASLESIELKPANEVILQKDNIENFKNSFLQKFGVNAIKEPIYESVSNNRNYPGIEHWLPLFYQNLDDIFSYIEAPIIVFNHLILNAVEERLKTIEDYYHSRLDSLKNKSLAIANYYPIEPKNLWLTAKEFENKLNTHKNIIFSSFDKEDNKSVYSGLKNLPNFIAESQAQNISVFKILREFSEANLKNSKGLHKRLKILITCFSESSRNRIVNIIEASDFHYQLIDNWEMVNKISPKSLGIAILPLETGFISEDIIVVTEQDLLGQKIYKKVKSRKRLENYLSEASSLTEGELVVHKEHGIGRFEGLETLKVGEISHDCIKILYAGGDKLYIPVENIDSITRYGTDEGGALDKLGGVAWQTRKAKLKDRIKLAAEELLKIAAERSLKKAPILYPVKGLYNEFCAKFPYMETEDQLLSIEEIEKDLASGVAMDRLICGDVGFGKTEIALRAAFIAVKSEESLTSGNKVQVAVIVPTTLLSRQHYKAVKERFAGFEVNIAQLSRLTPRGEVLKIKNGIKEGTVDIVVGTHALFAKNIEFKNLGLLIIDEEQHFGVAQKEKLKQLKSDVHILTLSATPIPRTLQMSLSGIKELSLIATPPIDRLAVRTYVMQYDPLIIREAILREFYRGGKIFYVSPRIKDLVDLEKRLKELVPEVKIIIAHGQMPPSKLDEIMNDFYDGKYDLLLCTTIVESGLDVPSANTIIIHRADILGLSQLYQLRGRVGRGKIRAFAYLTIPSNKILNGQADKRLKVMQTLDSLGAGFSLASHDMDIRGFGNLVGEEQSGHIKEVGIELYQEMLKEAVENLKETDKHNIVVEKEDFSIQINIGFAVLIPEEYITDLSLRLGLYRRVASLSSNIEIEEFGEEMIDRFGPLPEEFKNLLLTVKLKNICKELAIEKIDAGPKGVVLSFYKNNFKNPEALLNYVLKYPHKLKLRSDHKLVLLIESDQPLERFNLITKALNNIKEIT
ncbi:MAG: transcription-repair coupling factor [Alphaproteobacteria bacterium]